MAHLTFRHAKVGFVATFPSGVQRSIVLARFVPVELRVRLDRE